MNVERDSFYRTLGIQPGASPTEIKAAYRRLVKLYHPDYDKSLDAEVKYKEIRTAYKILRDCHLAGEIKGEPSTGHKFSSRTAWTSVDWTTEYDISNVRVPFEWNRLFSALFGGIPLLLMFTEGMGYVVVGVVLTFAVYFLCHFLEKYAYDDNIAGRMYFWFPFTASAKLCLFAHSCPLASYFLPIILCILGLFMPLNMIVRNPRSPSR